MNPKDLYRYIFERSFANSYNNNEFEFNKFYNECLQDETIHNDVLEACKYYNTLESFKYFQTLILNGGCDYDLMLNEFCKKQKNINTVKTNSISIELIKEWIVYVSKKELCTQQVLDLTNIIINNPNTIQQLHRQMNNIFNIFKIKNVEQLYMLSRNFQSSYFN